MKLTAKILSGLAIMVFMAVPAISSANSLVEEVAVEAAAPEGDAKETKEAKKETCDSEKTCCAEKKKAAEKKAE